MSRARLAGALLKGAYKALRSPAARKAAGKVFQLGNKTKGVASRAAVKAASNSSPAAKRIGARAAAKAADTAATGRTSRVINRARGTAPKPSQAALQRASRQRARNTQSLEYNRRGVADGDPWKANQPNKGSSNTPTRTPGVKQQVTPRPKPQTSPTRAERSRSLKSSLRDQGPNHVETTLRGQNVPAQARGDIRSASRNGVGQRTLGQSPQPKATNDNGKVTGRIVRNARAAANDAVDSFKAKAGKIISDRMSGPKAQAMPSRDRSNLKKDLEKRARAGASRIRHTVESGTNSSQTAAKNNTSSSVAFQDPKKGDPRRGFSQAQSERLSRDMSARKAQGKLPPIQQSTGTPRNAASNVNVTPEKFDQGLTKGNISGRTRNYQNADKSANAPATPRSPGIRTTPRSTEPGFARRLEEQAKGGPRDTSHLPSRNGKALKPQGQPKPNAGNVAQRTPNTQSPADTARQNRSDAALRQHNKSVDKYGTNLDDLMKSAYKHLTNMGRL
jgi:hypothetical protein